jgi:fructose-specific phosphotransferase system component IIB
MHFNSVGRALDNKRERVMNLIIVTACPNGKVSSVLSARLLDAAAQRMGWSTSVEVFDPRNPEPKLTADQIAAADWVLVVNTGEVDLARFVGKRPPMRCRMWMVFCIAPLSKPRFMPRLKLL